MVQLGGAVVADSVAQAQELAETEAKGRLLLAALKGAHWPRVTMRTRRPGRRAALHSRRLREIWRSAGWPCQDLIEVELLAAGLAGAGAPAERDTRRCVSPTRAWPTLLAETLTSATARGVTAHEDCWSIGWRAR